MYGSIHTLGAEDVAAAVLHAVGQPAHVAVNEILLRPTARVAEAHRPRSEIISPVPPGFAGGHWENGAVELVNDPLPITVATEDGSLLTAPTVPVLRALLARIGGPGDRFAVAERDPGVYLQTWREADSPFLVERRDGQDLWTELDDPADVAALFVAWSRREAWPRDYGWQSAVSVEP
jgi:hypothetical protein